MAVMTDRRVRRRPRPHLPGHAPGSTARAVGLGVITGAADDDPSAIGTYASAGARLGPAILWAAPALLPMMVVSVYLAAKLGQVAGQGLAAVVRAHYARWVLWFVVAAVVLGNTIEAAADLGGIGAAVHLFSPLPGIAVIVPVAAGILTLQIMGSYAWIRTVFRWLALALLAYIVSALLARPHWSEVVRATLLPHLHWNRHFLEILVAMIGTSGSPYLYPWQASQEVEEDVSMGRRRLSDRRGTTARALTATAWDVILGMFFSTVIMYFILLAAAATLFPAGIHNIDSAAQAASALGPLAGHAAGWLFAAGIIGVGILAVPVMTAGAAYMVCDALGRKSGLSAAFRDAPTFYGVIAAVTAGAVAINLGHFNPMHALVLAGVVQGFLAPGLLFLLIRLTNRPDVMGPWTNSLRVNVLAWLAAALSAAAALSLLIML